MTEPASSVEAPPTPGSEPSALLSHLIVQIDQLLTEQINKILHHPGFQRLEAAWRGVHYLVTREHARRVRVLSCTQEEIVRDIERAVEFDQTALFRLLYGPLDQHGDRPFSLVVLDAYMASGESEEDESAATIDAWTAGRIAGIASAAFAPVILGAHPSILGLPAGSFARVNSLLAPPKRLGRRTPTSRLDLWSRDMETLASSPDARFLGVTLPRVLMRQAYSGPGERQDGFLFQERIESRDDLLWGNAAFAFASVAMRAHASTGWLADIRGVRAGESGGGMVDDLPAQAFRVDHRRREPLGSTDVAITEVASNRLAELGLLVLSKLRMSPAAAFFSSPSLHAGVTPLRSDAGPGPGGSEQRHGLTSQLQYTLCASRFAHIIKLTLRDKVGEFTDASSIRTLISDILHRYTLASASGANVMDSPHLPLAGYAVEVFGAGGDEHRCSISLKPRFQLESVEVFLDLWAQRRIR